MSKNSVRNRGSLMSGLVMVALGTAFLLMEFSQGLGTATVLVLLGAAFVAGYFARHAYGSLIAGCILLGLGGGSLADTSGWGFGSFTTIGLGIGFIAIILVDLAYGGQFIWWPLVPGLALILTGAAQGISGFQNVLSLAEISKLQGVLSLAWPVALVLIGLFLLFTALGASEAPST